jgi:hypothetical protein
MQFLEKDLEQIIFETRNEDLQEKELYISGVKKRQLRIGNYGISDIVTIQRPQYYPKQSDGHGGFYVEPLTITVYELKQNKISVSAFLQVIRYAKGIKSYLSKRNLKIDYELNICLIGKEIDLSSELIYLTEFIDTLSLITYNYGIDGISFKYHNGFKLKEEGFNG